MGGPSGSRWGRPQEEEGGNPGRRAAGPGKRGSLSLRPGPDGRWLGLLTASSPAGSPLLPTCRDPPGSGRGARKWRGVFSSPQAGHHYVLMFVCYLIIYFLCIFFQASPPPCKPRACNPNPLFFICIFLHRLLLLLMQVPPPPSVRAFFFLQTSLPRLPVPPPPSPRLGAPSGVPGGAGRLRVGVCSGEGEGRKKWDRGAPPPCLSLSPKLVGGGCCRLCFTFSTTSTPSFLRPPLLGNSYWPTNTSTKIKAGCSFLQAFVCLFIYLLYIFAKPSLS